MTWKLSDAKLATREEVERLLGKMRKREEDYSFFATAANSGLRLSEILHLRAEDVTKNGISVIRRKKKDLTREVLPVSEALRKILERRGSAVRQGWLWPGASVPCVRILHLRRKCDGKVVKRWTERQQLCPGGHLHKREIQRRWRLYAEAARVYRPGFGAHCLRHYAATQFYAATRDLRATQVFLGHSSSNVTEVYCHVVDLADKVSKIKPVL